jgi:hypothetical protein
MNSKKKHVKHNVTFTAVNLMDHNANVQVIKHQNTSMHSLKQTLDPNEIIMDSGKELGYYKTNIKPKNERKHKHGKKLLTVTLDSGKEIIYYKSEKERKHGDNLLYITLDSGKKIIYYDNEKERKHKNFTPAVNLMDDNANIQVIKHQNASMHSLKQTLDPNMTLDSKEKRKYKDKHNMPGQPMIDRNKCTVM